MPTQLHSQARMMQFLAIVTSLVSFFRSLGGILALTIMSSVVNNKISDAFSSQLSSTSSSASSLSSIAAIDSLPQNVLALVRQAFSDAIRWAYVALLPFVCIAAISAFFLREVKIERSNSSQAERRKGHDEELGQVSPDSIGPVVASSHRGRVAVYGPITAIIWCFQALGDKIGWRK